MGQGAVREEIKQITRLHQKSRVFILFTNYRILKFVNGMLLVVVSQLSQPSSDSLDCNTKPMVGNLSCKINNAFTRKTMTWPTPGWVAGMLLMPVSIARNAGWGHGMEV